MKVINPISVSNKKIGDGQPIFTIAEIGINHDGKLSQAKKLIEVAAEAECDSAKFQLFSAKNMYVNEKMAGQYKVMAKEVSIYNLVESMELPEEWLPEIKDYCKSHGLLFFASASDFDSVDILDKIGVEILKFTSYDCTNLPLLSYGKKTKKSLIVSLGGANMQEITEAAATLRGAAFALMHCIAKYPAPLRYANLAVIETLKKAFGCPVGFSDNGFVNNVGNIDNQAIPEAAASVGADLFEIHITLDRKLPGLDHAFATEPAELKNITKIMKERRQDYLAGKKINISRELLGSPLRTTYDIEKYVREFAYRRIFAIRDIKKGEKFTAKNIAILRPGESKEHGLEPKYYQSLLKAHAARDILCWSTIQKQHVLESASSI